MVENTNQENYNNIFVDSSNDVAEKVNDSNDFYDDEVIEQPFQMNSSNSITEEKVEPPVPVQPVSLDDFSNDDVPVAKLDFDNIENGVPSEVSVGNSNVFNFSPVEKEEAKEDLPVKEEVKVEEVQEPNKLVEEVASQPQVEEEKEIKEEPLKEENDDKKFVVPSLTNEEMDKMIEEDNKKEQLDDSYVLSNFDVLFDSLYNDVVGANNLISDLIEKKSSLNRNEKILDDFKEKFDTPVLGEIPLISDGNNKSSIQKLVKYKKAETDKNNNGSVNMDSFQATEAFNSLCNTLTVTMNMNDEKVIVISSPEMSDGKSTVSLNLAKAMAKMGNKVLLMDMDLRRPSIHKKLNMANKNGVINLMGKIENINNCTHKNVVEGLDIIFSGGISPNPSEMLASKKMNDIVNKFKEVYDYIIIDSPPVNVVTDACIISQLSGGIVVVLRSNVAHYDDFKKTVENVDIARGKIVGVVINGVDDNTVKYGKKYKYGYKKGYYKYGYYTSNNENNDKTPKEA